MKKLLLMLSVLALISCSKEALETQNEENVSINETPQDRRLDPTEQNETEPVTETQLVAGQNTVVGDVFITLDEIAGTVTVTYETTGWEIEETHLYVGSEDGRPANNPGNPLIGQFPIAGEHAPGTTSVSYTVLIADLDIDPADPCIAIVAAHAVVNDGNGNEETAWGDGREYGGNSWAMYFFIDLCSP